MNRLANYAARAIALTVAAGITSLTLFVHAVDREQLGAPVATSTRIATRAHDTGVSTSSRTAQPATALAANRQH